jgi:hypothetical protein
MINCTKIQKMCQKIENTGLLKKFDFFCQKPFKKIQKYTFLLISTSSIQSHIKK